MTMRILHADVAVSSTRSICCHERSGLRGLAVGYHGGARRRDPSVAGHRSTSAAQIPTAPR